MSGVNWRVDFPKFVLKIIVTIYGRTKENYKDIDEIARKNGIE